MTEATQEPATKKEWLAEQIRMNSEEISRVLHWIADEEFAAIMIRQKGGDKEFVEKMVAASTEIKAKLQESLDGCVAIGSQLSAMYAEEK